MQLRLRLIEAPPDREPSRLAAAMSMKGRSGLFNARRAFERAASPGPAVAQEQLWRGEQLAVRFFRHSRLIGLGIGICCQVGAWNSTLAVPATLTIEIAPQFADEAIQPDSLRYQNSAGESFSITRLSYLLSDFALERVDGSWLELSNQVAWMDLEKERRSIRITEVAPAVYRSLRFYVGLNQTVNHAPAAQFAANDPLNPNLNGLHWSWQGGYIFMAIEGMWRSAARAYDGWSFHLARDTN
jgi:hypothetical protein